jgi:nicotinamidase-related amidase
MRILAEDTLGIIIDVQEKLFPVMHKNEKLLNNISSLIEGLKTLEVPMLITQQYPKGLGTTLEPVQQHFKMEEAIDKVSFSCCDEPRFMEKVSLHAKKNVVLAGIEAHVCVLQTCLDLLANGYQPVVIKDCVSSRKGKDKKAAMERMRSEGAVISTTESILFELCRYAGNEQFKAISRLVK